MCVPRDLHFPHTYLYVEICVSHQHHVSDIRFQNNALKVSLQTRGLSCSCLYQWLDIEMNFSQLIIALQACDAQDSKQVVTVLAAVSLLIA